MRPDPQGIDELVRRIVEAVHPLRIILFGSAARGDMGPDSDVDVLVVVPEGTHRRHTAQFLHTRFAGLGLSFGVDVIVATPEDLERYKDDIGFIYHTVLQEGKLIYATAA